MPWAQKTKGPIFVRATSQGLAKVKNDFFVCLGALCLCCRRCIAITQAGVYVFRAAGDTFPEEVIESNPPWVPMRPEGWEDEPETESEDEVLMQAEAMAQELEPEGPDWGPDEVEDVVPAQAAPGAPTFLPEAFDACGLGF